MAGCFFDVSRCFGSISDDGTGAWSSRLGNDTNVGATRSARLSPAGIESLSRMGVAPGRAATA